MNTPVFKNPPNIKGQGGFAQFGLQKGKQGIVEPSGEESLKAEARKYKTAEGWIETQGEPLYHGGKEEIKIFDTSKGRQGGVYLTNDLGYAKIFSGKKGSDISTKGITEAFFKPEKSYKIEYKENDLLIEAPNSHSQYIKELKEKGYDSIISSDGRKRCKSR